MSETPEVYRQQRRITPEIGILSQRHWRQNRIDDILEAIECYRRCRFLIPVEWAAELAEHLEWVDSDCKQQRVSP